MDSISLVNYFPFGINQGIKVVSISNFTIECVSFPRRQIKQLTGIDKLSKPGVYLLYGIDEDNKRKIYIGESGNCIKRIKDHHSKQKFDWSEGMVFISSNDFLTKVHVKYLESQILSAVRTTSRYPILNDGGSTPPSVPEYMTPELDESFRIIKLITTALGLPLFEPIVKEEERENYFYCKSGPNIEAKGIYTEEGFVVLKESKASLGRENSDDKYTKKVRNELIEDDILILKDDFYLFKENKLFESPSRAAVAILGRRANGWTEWKNDKGTLNEQFRVEN